MIKKIMLTLFICFLIVSCGKKGDPEYKDPKKKICYYYPLISRLNEIY